MADATALLGQPDLLRERWAEDGVLFFRGAIGADAVARVRTEYLRRLQDVGLVAADETEPRWTGRDRVDGALARPIADAIWRDLVADPSLDRIVRTFLGEAPTWLPIVVHRTAPPAPPAAAARRFAAQHQDGVYNYGIPFVTCWIPLMDIDDEVGGLAVVPGSHKASLYPPDTIDTAGQRQGRTAEAIPDSAWRRPSYRAGDLLMFHSMTAHAGLPNRSGRFRLSTDIRFLPGSLKPFVGHVAEAGEDRVVLTDDAGSTASFAIDEATIVRGPKGHPVTGPDRDRILFPRAEIIVTPDDRGTARLIRSVSRKYVDLPAAWYDSFPVGWVS